MLWTKKCQNSMSRLLNSILWQVQWHLSVKFSIFFFLETNSHCLTCTQVKYQVFLANGSFFTAFWKCKFNYNPHVYLYLCIKVAQLHSLLLTLNISKKCACTTVKMNYLLINRNESIASIFVRFRILTRYSILRSENSKIATNFFHLPI